MKSYDAIVLGLGGIGSATLFHLAKRGLRVLGIEQFPLVHDRGSSHGQTRIIRTAYYEHPAYVPLVRRSFELWRELESRSGQSLLVPTPCLTVGTPDGELITGVKQAAKEHHLSTTSLSAREVERSFPTFRVGNEYVGIVEQDAGILFVEKCVRAHLDAARQQGAEILAETPVRNWSADDRGITVNTDHGMFSAAKLAICPGAWAPALLNDLGVPLTVMRQTMHWFQSSQREAFAPGRFPVFMLDTSDGAFYGIPAVDERGVKIARHYGAPELAGPEQVNWNLDERDERPVREFLSRHIPSAPGLSTGVVCMYTLTPDRHFVIDVHPRHANVAVACGFSGHGFKFAPAAGEIMADLVHSGQTANERTLFSATRFLKR